MKAPVFWLRFCALEHPSVRNHKRQKGDRQVGPIFGTLGRASLGAEQPKSDAKKNRSFHQEFSENPSSWNSDARSRQIPVGLFESPSAQVRALGSFRKMTDRLDLLLRPLSAPTWALGSQKKAPKKIGALIRIFAKTRISRIRNEGALTPR